MGEVKIEWDTSSLVIPVPVDPEREGHEADLEMEVDHLGKWKENVAKAGPIMAEAAGREMDFDKQVDLMVDLTTSKAALIDRLVTLIVTYNSAYYYHAIGRNCQDFVLAAMKALGICNPATFPWETARILQLSQQEPANSQHLR